MAIVTKLCEWCDTDFQARVFPSRSLERSRFCSRKCLGYWTGQQRNAAAIETRSCPICDQNYETTQHHGGRKYCSSKCVRKAQSIRQRNRPSTKITLICESCGRTYQRSPCRQKDGEHHFCSPKCRGTYQTSQGIVKRACAVCSKPYSVSKAQIKLRGSKYCSRKCMNLSLSVNRRAENNPNWHGGPVEYGSNWSFQRKQARKRDNYTCRNCDVKRRGLDVHHIIPIRFFENDFDSANDLSNLITLCRQCHKTIERINLFYMPT